MTTPTTIRPTDLPTTVRTFLAAHTAGEPDAAVRTFHADAVVTDEGHTFRGTAQILDFLRHAGSEFTYTTELIGAERIDTEWDDVGHWVAVVRLEGDFPGGVAQLRYRFTLIDDLITELIIAP